MLNSTHNVENPTFQKNFFNDFKDILKKTGGAKNRQGEKVDIKEFAKCDFRPIFDYYDAERTAKKAMSKEEKKALKQEKDEAEAPFTHCIWDGKKQKVGNFRVEPPACSVVEATIPRLAMSRPGSCLNRSQSTLAKRRQSLSRQRATPGKRSSTTSKVPG